MPDVAQLLLIVLGDPTFVVPPLGDKCRDDMTL
jgi:hypothetical protein